MSTTLGDDDTVGGVFVEGDVRQSDDGWRKNSGRREQSIFVLLAPRTPLVNGVQHPDVGHQWTSDALIIVIVIVIRCYDDRSCCRCTRQRHFIDVSWTLHLRPVQLVRVSIFSLCCPGKGADPPPKS